MSDNTATQQPKLEDRIREACRVRHYSLATERSYVRWYRQFVRWAGLKHPATLGGDRVEAWLSHLATERDVAASTQRQALAAILFLYKQVLGMAMPWLDNITRAKQPQRLPRVLSQPEIKAVLTQLPRTSAGLAVALVYGTGMRRSDVLRMRVQDLDFDRRTITIRDGKGGKDRTTMLPASLADGLRAQLAKRAQMHALDTMRGLHDSKNGDRRAIPAHPKIRHLLPLLPLTAPKITIQRAWQRARAAAGMDGVHFHDLRHSAASEMLNAGIDLHTIGRVLGHRDARSTQRYAHLTADTLAAAVATIGKRRLG